MSYVSFLQLCLITIIIKSTYLSHLLKMGLRFVLENTLLNAYIEMQLTI